MLLVGYGRTRSFGFLLDFLEMRPGVLVTSLYLYNIRNVDIDTVLTNGSRVLSTESNIDCN